MNNNKNILQDINVQQLLNMFDLLPDVIFWIKDNENRIIHGNKNLTEHLGFKSLAQGLGKSDSHLSKSYIAKHFLIDDKKVLTGECVIDRYEMNIRRTDELAWFFTSKRPLFDEVGNIIGSYGVTSYLEKAMKNLSGVDLLTIPVTYIRENYNLDITVYTLAAISNLSVSTLERCFKKYLLKTPNQFIRQIRLEQARSLID